MAAVRVTSLLSMDMLRNTFVTTVARFTQLHAPASMALKNAQAFRALLVIADENGNHLGVCPHHMTFDSPRDTLAALSQVRPGFFQLGLCSATAQAHNGLHSSTNLASSTFPCALPLRMLTMSLVLLQHR